MEDKSHTRVKKAQGQLDLFSKNSTPFSSTGSSFSKKVLRSNDKRTLNDIPSVMQNSLLNKTSLEKIRILITDVYTTREPFDAKPVKKGLNSIEKKVRRYLLGTQLLQTPKSLSILTSFDKLNEVNRLFSMDISPNNFPGIILNLKYFERFQSCQVLVHERGNPNITKYSCNRAMEQEQRKIPVKVFHDIYNIIKKSKNKYFDQSQILKRELGIVGTFLAKDIDLKNHRIIFLISRNEFLPPTPVEKSNFNDLNIIICPIFARLFSLDQAGNKLKNLLTCLGHFPWSIRLIDSSLNVIYQKEPASIRNISEFPISQVEFPLSDKGEKILIELPESELVVTDIQHFQRISLLGELLNTLQHELSNPLFGVKLSAEIMSNESVDIMKQDLLAEIVMSSMRCQTIIKNFSTLYSNEKSFLSVEIKKLVEETLTLTKSETRNIKKIITTDGDFPKDGLEILTNPTWLSQILFNIIINSAQAIKSNPQNILGHSIKINLSYDRTHDMLKIDISDTGPGIPAEYGELIFKPFFTTKSRGTGLGLSICKRLTSKLNGQLSYQNNKEAGTTFSLSFANIK